MKLFLQLLAAVLSFSSMQKIFSVFVSQFSCVNRVTLGLLIFVHAAAGLIDQAQMSFAIVHN